MTKYIPLQALSRDLGLPTQLVAEEAWKQTWEALDQSTLAVQSSCVPDSPFTQEKHTTSPLLGLWSVVLCGGAFRLSPPPPNRGSAHCRLDVAPTTLLQHCSEGPPETI